jgi:exosortase B
MSTVLASPSLRRPAAHRVAWLAILAGLAALYIPTYIDLARGLWRDDAYAHGPIVLAVFAWLVWRSRDALAGSVAREATVAGALSVAFGLALFVVGRSQSIALFEVASHIPVIGGIVLMAGGVAALRRLAFPLLLLLFLVPLPGFILDAATTPLKGVVSLLAEAILKAIGYPVEREGVVLRVDDHEMFLADACSGLNSIYSLAALTLIYAHLTGRSRRGRLALLLAAIVPIAIVANAIRVTILVLVTVHAGEEAAQGLLHGVAGMVVFLVALGAVIALDRAVFPAAKLDPRPLPSRAPGMTQPRGAPGMTQQRRTPGMTMASFLFIAMLGAAIAAPALKPVRAEGPAVDLEQVVPATFGDWHIDPTIVPVAPTPDVQEKLDRLYGQVVNRAYVNAAGDMVMLTIAYGGDQSDALKVHRQEKCYSAQGFDIHGLEHARLDAAGRTIPVTRMVAVRGERIEPVTYWFTMGERVVLGRAERLRTQLAAGLERRVLDGMLVRVSSFSKGSDAGTAFAAQQAFASSLFAAMPEQATSRFVGARS